MPPPRSRGAAGCAPGTAAVLVEQSLPGAEITVGITGNGAAAAVLGMMEIAPAANEQPFVYSVDVKRDWRRRARYHVPPRVAAVTETTLQQSR